MDVSSHQQNVDWVSAYAAGSRFAYVKATEGTYYTNPYFAQQYNGSPQFGTLPLHLASYSTVVGAIPAGWSGYDIWQFTDSGTFVGDSNFFPGTVNDLKVLAKNPNAVHRNWANGQDRVVEERALEDRAAQDPNLVTTATGSIDIRTGIGNFWNKNRAFYGNPIGTEYSPGATACTPRSSPTTRPSTGRTRTARAGWSPTVPWIRSSARMWLVSAALPPMRSPAPTLWRCPSLTVRVPTDLPLPAPTLSTSAAHSTQPGARRV